MTHAGAGAALMEHVVVAKRAGIFVSHDLAGDEVTPRPGP